MARHRMFTLLAAGAVLVGTTALPAQTERKLEISFQDGTVTLVAANVTVREILAEWSRKGGSHIINGDKVMGGPVTLQFEQAPERVVMDSLLRSAAGYVLGPRFADSTAASQFGVISILPTSQAVAAPASAGMPTSAPVRTGPDDEIPPVTPPPANVNPPASAMNPPANAPAPTDPTVNRPPVGVPGSGVVPIIPVPSTPPATTGRGRGGGGGGGA